LQSGQPLLFLGQLLPFCFQVAIENDGFSPDFYEFLFQSGDDGLKVFPRFLDNEWLSELGQNKQQNNGAKGTTDTVQKGQVENVDTSAS
jgi:hypothetical protein